MPRSRRYLIRWAASHRRWRKTWQGRLGTVSCNMKKAYGTAPSPAELRRSLGPPERCYLCGCALRLDQAEVDHAFPVARSGANVLDNLRWAHRNCNRAKMDLTVHEFYDLSGLWRRHLGRTRGRYV